MRGTLLPPSSFDLDLGMSTSVHDISLNHYWMWRRRSTTPGLLAGARVHASMRGASSSWTDRGNRWSQSRSRRQDVAAAAVSSEAAAAPRRPHQPSASAVSSAQNAFYIVREEIQGSAIPPSPSALAPSLVPLSLPLVANFGMLPLFIWLRCGVLSAENCFCIFYSSTVWSSI
ncbi:hypothetical protein CFC21_087738 [Triticum aestivum]|uniref:Uncharacterized protein n=2 Tax=Triticum aestivum TaxID=4565 RepID=A0A3B6PJM0_WHEAT|nr:uncharacterized protein LOC123136637 [Triticum aestivum]KAF7084041.1 hypothetical protein CFC21_087738 [Triticum aestivum]